MERWETGCEPLQWLDRGADEAGKTKRDDWITFRSGARELGKPVERNASTRRIVFLVCVKHHRGQQITIVRRARQLSCSDRH